MDNIENIIRQIGKRRKDQNKAAPMGACISEEDISCLIDNALDGKTKKKIVAHIISCSQCAQNLKAHYDIITASENKGLLDVPIAAVERAKGLVPDKIKENILDIVLELKEKAIEIINTTGNIVFGAPTPAYALRGIDKDKTDDEGVREIRISKAFRDFSIDVEVEAQKPELANLIVRFSDKTSQGKESGIRVSLMKGDRELESLLAEGGKVKFEAIHANNYKISLTRDNAQIGVINISINQTR